MTDYPQTPLNRVKRNPKRAVYDRATTGSNWTGTSWITPSAPGTA
ncbi:hypothetical protein [Gemmobacter sp.]|nr:hypothetical protein [Gemmobacter sp.]